MGPLHIDIKRHGDDSFSHAQNLSFISKWVAVSNGAKRGYAHIDAQWRGR